MKTIYINEYLEDGHTILGGCWFKSESEALRGTDRNYLRTVKFVEVTNEQADLTEIAKLVGQEAA